MKLPDAGQTASTSASVSARGGPAGDGGTGGNAGSAGKVYQNTMEVTPGQVISYSCGTGGTTNGAMGGETTFGTESSASGGVLQAGYADIVTGIIYALPGTSGGDGGNGGSNGSYGEDVGNASGGRGVSSDSGSESDTYTYSHMYVVDATGSYNHGGAGGGGAGGSAGNTSGDSGKNGRGSSFSFFVFTDVEAEYGQIRGGSGGDGANGAAGETYGSAGSGGGGGGGGGAAGNVSVSVNGSVEMLRDVTGAFTVKARAAPPIGGGGGQGGAGGAGADGCIILYYGAQREVDSGPLVTADNKLFRDKLNRLIVV